MSALAIWGTAALVYLGFRGWYDNWRGPIRPEEIDHYLALGDQTSMDEVNDMALIRRFLEEDDGKEFVMLNLVKLHPKPVPHPKTGELTRAPQLLRGYIGDFMPTLLRPASPAGTQGRALCRCLGNGSRSGLDNRRIYAVPQPTRHDSTSNRSPLPERARSEDCRHRDNILFPDAIRLGCVHGSAHDGRSRPRPRRGSFTNRDHLRATNHPPASAYGGPTCGFRRRAAREGPRV